MAGFRRRQVTRPVDQVSSETRKSTAAGGARRIPDPYLLFLGDVTEPGYAKTAFGLRDWAADKIVGEYASAQGTVSAGLPFLTPAEAKAAGARSMVIGVANSGGLIPSSWHPALMEALEAGLDLVAGMHVRLRDVPGLAETADRLGRTLFDVRVPPKDLAVATGRKRSGRRLLTIGTDCALGKKYSALAMTRALRARGIDADFRATGQTGILIAGGGIPIDAVVADFAAGAAEMLSLDAPADHWDVIEGQGSLLHPAYAGVSLSLLHGSQPDVLVACHEAGRTHILGYPGHKVPEIEVLIDIALRLGRVTNPAIRCAGVAINTSRLSDEEADRLLDSESRKLGLPVADPLRGGPRFDRLIDRIVG